MIEFILASGNAHKAQEFATLFADSALTIKAAPEKLDVAETGDSFVENAYLKAQAYYEKFKTPVMSDDSGLVVEALPDELGVQSARFGGDNLTDRQRSELLLQKLQDLKTADERKAYFVCYLCFYLNPQEIYFFEGRLNGYIAQTHQGDGGFGYDPVFIPEKLAESDAQNTTKLEALNQTLAQLTEWKNEHSHRARAVFEAKSFFKGRF